MPDTAQFRSVHNLPEHGCLYHVGITGVCACVHCIRDREVELTAHTAGVHNIVEDE